MKRPYLRVEPGTGHLIHHQIPEIIESLHKLSRPEPDSILQRLNPFTSQPPIRFEFVVLCAGENAPVEFYYGADDNLGAFEQRLESMYSPSAIDRTDVDIIKRLITPMEFTPEEFAERLQDGRLYANSLDTTAIDPVGVSDGGVLADSNDRPGADDGESGPEESLEEVSTEEIIDNLNLEPPRAIPENQPLTALDAPAKTIGGNILARPSLSEVEPYGVEWWGKAARRKDWMTTLTEFTDILATDGFTTDEEPSQGRLPLTPLVQQLVEIPLPVAFQVVFRRHPDWSSDARRRFGDLLNGSDTLLQTILSLETTGSGKSSGTGRETSHNRGRPTSRPTHRGGGPPNSDSPPRPSGMEEGDRYDLIRSNSPKRTFTANLRLLALPVEDERTAVAEYLDQLRSAFDLVDGQFYEIAGRRLRSHGYLPGSGDRHAHAVWEQFTERSIVTGGMKIAITNRGETRPDLVLNGNELANFIVIPTDSDISGQVTHQESIADTEPDDPGGDGSGPMEPTSPTVSTSESPEPPHSDDESFFSVPGTIVHRDSEVAQLTDAFETFTSGEDIDAVFVTGPTGAGKTATAKFTVDQLCGKHPALRDVYVNCWEYRSRFQVLYRILDEIETAVDIHRQSTPRDVLLDRLREYNEGPCIVILDEVDQLEDKSLLYELFNLPRIALLLIVNEGIDFLQGLDERLASRLRGCERIRFGPYSADELVDVLRVKAREEEGMSDFGESELEKIADTAEGDARVAWKTLQIVDRRIDRSEDGGITQSIVESARHEANPALKETSIERLDYHQKSLLEIIEEEGRIPPSDLYDAYLDRVDDPKSDRTVREYLNKLSEYNLIIAEGSTRNRVYRSLSNRNS